MQHSFFNISFGTAYILTALSPNLTYLWNKFTLWQRDVKLNKNASKALQTCFTLVGSEVL